ncbi:MAG: GntR family transcriptional regulator [Tissierellia bacterium]|nr:GntR family transcriptional regulator [Tissierellia bacterium]
MDNRQFSRANSRKSLASIAYESIREMILDGQIQEGDILPETALAKRLKMSRTPIREAIRKLENEGILVSIDGVGTFLTSISLKDIIDMYEVRTALEVIALKTSINNMDRNELIRIQNGIQEVFHLLLGGVDERNCTDQLNQLDTELHNLIVHDSDNDYVKRVMEEINFKIMRNRKAAYETYTMASESAMQHLTLIDRFLVKDYAAASGLLRDHILWSQGILENFILRR